jgi:chloramphenicol O-acetyltransferase
LIPVQKRQHLQQMLKLPTSTDEQFAACDIDHLTQLLTQLQQQFKDQVP